MVKWYQLEPDEALDRLQTDKEQGLSEEEVALRRAEYGLNELEEKEGRPPLAILAAQFTEVMVIVLLVAAAISYFIGDLKDTIAILIIVLLNALLGFTQEYRAERAMAALKRLAVSLVKVRRGGQVRELVPGDVVLLEAGGRVRSSSTRCLVTH